jgi:Thiamine pyrophosphate-requiring enzymes [acetolactate synthase, pyruvate dehydrogenase (cytochrome), glyoxylate carboligase, phosphonopyruvate decarboxylase]
MKRFDCLSQLAPLVKDDDLVVTTLGWVAGEWFAVRHKESNLYQVNMGMCTPLCLGLALVLPHRRVIAIESDGSVLLNLGAMTTLANKRPPNLTVIVFDNQCYMATGGLPTATAGVTDLAGMANAAGIENSYTVTSPEEFESETRASMQRKGPSYIVAKVEAAGTRMSTDMDGKEGKYRFVRYIEKTEGIKIIGTAAK